jgi:hypothetical protein
VKISDLLWAATDKQGKRQWIKCGIALDKDDGKRSIKLEVIPVGFDGWLVISDRNTTNIVNKPEEKSDLEPF